MKKPTPQDIFRNFFSEKSYAHPRSDMTRTDFLCISFDATILTDTKADEQWFPTLNVFIKEDNTITVQIIHPSLIMSELSYESEQLFSSLYENLIINTIKSINEADYLTNSLVRKCPIGSGHGWELIITPKEPGSVDKALHSIEYHLFRLCGYWNHLWENRIAYGKKIMLEREKIINAWQNTIINTVNENARAKNDAFSQE